MTKAVILAGGRGIRLSPITDSIPKPMMPIGDKPFLYYLLEMLKKNKINEAVICVGYLKDKIMDYFGDGSRFGLRLEYSAEKEFLGTAGALKLAEGLLPEDFILLYGDSYLPIDYQRLLDSWAKYKSEVKALAVCYDNKPEIAGNNVFLDEAGFIRSYDKHRADKKMNYVEAGVILFKKDVLKLIPENKAVSLEEDVFPELIKQGSLKGYPVSQRFYDIGTPRRLEEIKGALL